MNAPPYSGASVLQSSYRMGGRLPQSLDQFTGAAGGADGLTRRIIVRSHLRKRVLRQATVHLYVAVLKLAINLLFRSL